MPHLVQTLTGAEARMAATDSPPLGPGVDEENALDIDTLEVWGSSFGDSGEDWCEFRAFARGIQKFAALLFDTYRRPGIKTLSPTWLVSVPSGILIRKVLFHTPSSWGSTGIFIAVALVFTLIFLLAARLGVGFLSRASAKKQASSRDRVGV